MGMFSEMRHEGIQPDVITCNTLFSVCAHRILGLQAEMLFRTMNEGGVGLAMTTYSYLVDTFELGSIREAMDVIRKMLVGGCVPNAATCSILLNLYGKCGRYDNVQDLFLEMKASNTDLDDGTYNILIQVFGQGGQYEEAVNAYVGMEKENYDSNVQTLEAVSSVYCHRYPTDGSISTDKHQNFCPDLRSDQSDQSQKNNRIFVYFWWSQ
ncbi:unnamed protein product [Lupinus luteus]|uniref:Pentatricopeptide repeat-containing protein n=1 Tax=Lupinus luteus TaxID=3873 RepID=A0AAV1YB24_LUPLU